MRTMPIGGVNVHYETIADLGVAIESEITSIDNRLKKLDGERRKLLRDRRALRNTLGDKQKRPAPASPKSVLVAA